MFDFPSFRPMLPSDAMGISHQIAYGTGLNRHAFAVWLNLGWLFGGFDRPRDHRR